MARLPKPSLKPDIELQLMAEGYQCIVGIDEVGRGPIAGPVVAAAVILDLNNVPEGLGDSKAIPAKRREIIYEEIMKTAQVAVAEVSHEEIDRINIRQATLQSMLRAVVGLKSIPDIALVDGNDPPPLSCKVTTIVKGDAKVASIAAASIVAKVTRDRFMAEISKQYPAYGFERNVGYGTAEHLAAIEANGPCPFHRMSFAPLRQGILAL
ncbi:ribonuclease HII [Microvirga sp. W0021]|uniref:Ribonuclease HII n=1 Tax=Hohaiivirga grylli TaxID=3133970 RepID=A0ABV0BIA2_9HYPH